MEILLVFGAGDNARLLEQVVVEMGVFDFVGLGGNYNGKILAETGWIVVSDRLAVTKSLKYWVTDLNSFLNSKLLSKCLWIMKLLIYLLVVEIDESETLLIGLSLTRTWFPGNDHGLGLFQYE